MSVIYDDLQGIKDLQVMEKRVSWRWQHISNL